MIKSIIPNKHCPKCNAIMYLGKRFYPNIARFYYLCSNKECEHEIIEHKEYKK